MPENQKSRSPTVYVRKDGTTATSYGPSRGSRPPFGKEIGPPSSMGRTVSVWLRPSRPTSERSCLNDNRTFSRTLPRSAERHSSVRAGVAHHLDSGRR